MPGKTRRQYPKDRKTAKVTVTKTVKALAPTTRAQVAQIARQAVRTEAETKYRAESLSTEGPIMIYGDVAPVGVTTQLYGALPTLPNGDLGFQHEGQKVSPVKHTLELDFTFNNQVQAISGGGVDACSWDITVHVWYGYCKRYKSLGDVLMNTSAIVNEMYELGNGNSGRFTGAPDDALRKLNTEVVTLKRKSFRMYRPLGAQNQATLAGGLTTYFPQLIKKRLVLGFKPPKTLLYDEAVPLPENYAPFVIIGYEHNDATQAANVKYVPGTPTILNTPAIQVQGLKKLWFKDT